MFSQVRLRFGQAIEDEGVMCYIFNAGAWGGADLPEAATISASDGLLDVLILNKSVTSIRAFASYELNIGPSKTHMHHWQAKEINRVIQECDPEGAGIDLSLLEHVSPIGWENIILYGEYVLNPNLVRI